MNAARQMQIYLAMGWDVPVYAHIPLDPRAGRQEAVEAARRGRARAIRAMGYPAAGMRNYLARLGWSHGDDEFFTDEQAKSWFELEGIGRLPARKPRLQEAREHLRPAHGCGR